MKVLLATSMVHLVGAFAANANKVVKVDLSRLGISYYQVQIEVGSNRDSISLWLDTQAADISVPKNESYHLEKCGDVCFNSGAFNETASTSFHVNDTDARLAMPGIYIPQGFWGHDTVVAGGTTVEDVSFCVTTNMTYGFGTFGIGKGNLSVYENLPFKMKSQGLINRAMYSLFLNTSNATTGELLFGGVDHTKYKGQLTTVPVVPVDDQYPTVILLGVLVSNISMEYPFPAHIDVGVPSTVFPSKVLERLGAALGAWNESGTYNVPCSLQESGMLVGFNFSGAFVEVPVSEFVLSYHGSCTLNSDEINTGEFVLGQDFLRSAYVVYDLEDDTVSFAQAKYSGDDGDDNIVAISNTIPGATKAPYYTATAYNASDVFHTSSTVNTSKGDGVVHGTSILGLASVVLAYIAIF